MRRLLAAPAIIGILAAAAIYFVSPWVVSAADTVALVARAALGLSNAFFDTMPPALAGYINRLNLPIAALTTGLVSTVAIYLLVFIGSLPVFAVRRIISYLQKAKNEDEPKDLPPIEMESGFEGADGGGVLGRGLDSIDRN